MAHSRSFNFSNMCFVLSQALIIILLLVDQRTCAETPSIFSSVSLPSSASSSSAFTPLNSNSRHKRAPGWGKRSPLDEVEVEELVDEASLGEDDSSLDKRAPGWGKRAPGWGKRAPGWGKRAPGWGKRAPGWGKRAPGWGKRSSHDFLEEENSLEADFEKRAPGWGKRAPGWGKRAPGWGKRAPGWGKRAPGWGKRAPGWGKRAPGWGKRSSDEFEDIEEESSLSKRAPGWGKRAPGWGKRSATDRCATLEKVVETYTHLARLAEKERLQSCGSDEASNEEADRM